MINRKNLLAACCALAFVPATGSAFAAIPFVAAIQAAPVVDPVQVLQLRIAQLGQNPTAEEILEAINLALAELGMANDPIAVSGLLQSLVTDPNVSDGVKALVTSVDVPVDDSVVSVDTTGTSTIVETVETTNADGTVTVTTTTTTTDSDGETSSDTTTTTTTTTGTTTGGDGSTGTTNTDNTDNTDGTGDTTSRTEDATDPPADQGDGDGNEDPYDDN